MASSTRVQLTHEELSDIITCLEKDASFNRKLFKKLNKALSGLQPSAAISNIDRYVGLNPNHTALYGTDTSRVPIATKPTDSIIEIVMNKLATDEVVTQEERELFHSVAGYYPV